MKENIREVLITKGYSPADIHALNTKIYALSIYDEVVHEGTTIDDIQVTTNGKVYLSPLGIFEPSDFLGMKFHCFFIEVVFKFDREII